MPHESNTIACQLTATGRAAIATVAVRGPEACRIVDSLFRSASSTSIAQTPPGRILLGHWHAPQVETGQTGGQVGEELVVCRLRENCIEIHCHGGQAAVEAIRQSLARQGCRLVDWREFSLEDQRSPIGREASEALRQATTERTAAILLDQYHGALLRALQEIRDVCQPIAAGVNGGECHDHAGGKSRGQVEVDRRREPTTAQDPHVAARQACQQLLAFADVGLHLTQPWRVTLVGQPNVGKSSLINAMLGFSRASVVDQPGTTLDVVTDRTAIAGWPVELADTAGLSDGGQPLEQSGVRQAQTRLARSDLIVLVHDASRPGDAGALRRKVQPHVPPSAPILDVLNKCDLRNSASPRVGTGWIETSALRGEGIDALLQAIVSRLVPRVPARGAAVPFKERHVSALRAAVEALDADRPHVACRILDGLLCHDEAS